MDILYAAEATSTYNKVSSESVFASNLMFYMGIAAILAICAGILIFALSLLPKRIISCPASMLAKARKVVILFKDNKIVVPEGSKEFSEIVSNFTDERQQSESQVVSTALHVYVKNVKYALQISLSGWNFLGEEKNSRRLLNNMQPMYAIDSLLDQSARAKFLTLI
ncbi:MAG: hypothetical protein WC574_00530 [Candidatus Omnitrophota bacterium]